MKQIKNFLNKTSKGASVVEYAIIAGILGTASIGAVLQFGGAVDNRFIDVRKKLNSGVAVNSSAPPATPSVLPLIFEIDSTLDPQNDFKFIGEGTFTIDWGDADANSSCGTSFTTGTIACVYPNPGNYTITIDGNLTAFKSALGLSSNTITRVVQWGTTGLTSLDRALFNAKNVTSVAADFPTTVTDVTYMMSYSNIASTAEMASWDVSNVQIFDGMFYNTPLNPDVTAWNVSSGQSFYRTFRDMPNFNQDISGWDMSSAISIAEMFQNSDSFNAPIGAWDVSNIQIFGSAFAFSNFNQDISSWNLISATSIASMFASNDFFNQDISAWNVSGVTSFFSLFNGADAFNQDISGWDVSSGTSFTSMFANTLSFSGDISAWNVSSGTNFRSMFEGSQAMVSDLSGWDMSNATDVSYMFSSSNYNQPLPGWRFPSIPASTGMTGMFRFHTSFSQDLSSWCVPNVASTPTNFKEASSTMIEPTWGSACP